MIQLSLQGLSQSILQILRLTISGLLQVHKLLDVVNPDRVVNILKLNQFNKSNSLQMLGTYLVVEVDHFRWNLEALLSASSQGIDSTDQILLH